MSRVTAYRSAWSVGGLMWGVAWFTLFVGGIVSPTDAEGILSLSLLGHGLTLMAIGIEIVQRKMIRTPIDANFVSAILVIFVLIEVAAFASARREREASQAIWFAAGLSFSAVSMLACRRGGASDGAIAAQILFQCLMVVPALGAAVVSAFSWLGSAQVASAVTRSGPITARLFDIIAVCYPISFVTNLAVLASDYSNASERPSRVWTTLLVHEAAFVLLAARRAYDGI